MSDQKQTELLGNSPFLYAHEPGPIDGFRIMPGESADIAEIEAHYEKLRDRMTAELEHDEEGIDSQRVAGFLEKYGLQLHPFIAIQGDKVVSLEAIVGEQVSDEGRTLGAHIPSADITYIIRDKEFEEGNTAGITEAVLVHEQAHANKSLLTIVYGKDEEGIFSGRLRSGFSVEDGTEEGSGDYYEEGFAALMAHKYVTEELGKPNGFSDWGGAQLISVGGDETFKIPRSYWFPTSKHNRFGAVDTPAFAAFGMELLIAKDPAIFDAMLKARHSTEGLREFAQRVERLDKGLYRLLGRQPYKLSYFVGATSHIIDTLYDGDQDKAIAAVSSAKAQ